MVRCVGSGIRLTSFKCWPCPVLIMYVWDQPLTVALLTLLLDMGLGTPCISDKEAYEETRACSYVCYQNVESVFSARPLWSSSQVPYRMRHVQRAYQKYQGEREGPNPRDRLHSSHRSVIIVAESISAPVSAEGI